MTERRTVLQGDRRKAYRPIPLEARQAALAAGLAAYDHGEFFEAHELLEPAWMGTDDLGERAFFQGLIKVAAGFVHATRGNALGIRKNLAGARGHLGAPGAAEPGRRYGIDVAELISRVDRTLAGLETGDVVPIEIPRLSGGGGHTELGGGS
jgi:predicted metal-dependent hydrolase